jgi:hypothetical protein
MNFAEWVNDEVRQVRLLSGPQHLPNHVSERGEALRRAQPPRVAAAIPRASLLPF